MSNLYLCVFLNNRVAIYCLIIEIGHITIILISIFIIHKGRSATDFEDEYLISSSGAPNSQPFLMQPYNIFSIQLISCLEYHFLWYNGLGATQRNSKARGLQFTTENLGAMAIQPSGHHFQMQYFKCISLAVLVSFIFWWWYHSIWLCSFLQDTNDNTKHLDHLLPNQRLRQKHVLQKCEPSECVISAKENATYLSLNKRQRYNILQNKYQKDEKQTYLNQR